jgi:hypothetical protein
VPCFVLDLEKQTIQNWLTNMYFYILIGPQHFFLVIQKPNLKHELFTPGRFFSSVAEPEQQGIAFFGQSWSRIEMQLRLQIRQLWLLRCCSTWVVFKK